MGTRTTGHRLQATGKRKRAARAPDESVPLRRQPAPPAAARGPAERSADDQLWADFSRERSVAARNALCVRYLPLAERIAARIAARVGSLTPDELTGAGVEGLLEAIEAFEPDRGLQFATFAPWRIRGAIFDWLRRIDTVPRSVRAACAEVDQLARQLEQQRGERVTPGELAEQAEAAQLKMRDAQPKQVFSLSVDEVRDEERRGVSLAEAYGWLADRKTPGPQSRAARRETWHVLSKGLDIEEQIVLYLYHFKSRTMKEIAESLLLSESRVSQLHTNIAARIRQKMTSVEAFELLRA